MIYKDGDGNLVFATTEQEANERASGPSGPLCTCPVFGAPACCQVCEGFEACLYTDGCEGCQNWDKGMNQETGK